MEAKIENQKIVSSTKVNIVDGKLSLLTSKKPVLVEYNGKQYPCVHYVDVALLAIEEADRIDHDKLINLAESNFGGRLVFCDDPDETTKSMRNGKKTSVDKVVVELHGSGKDLGQFTKDLIAEFGVSEFIVYVK